MYLHLGQDITIRQKDIVGIFDLDNTTVSKTTRDFLKKGGQLYDIVNITDELPKSFVLVDTPQRTTVYLSQLLTQTLYKRAKNINENLTGTL